MNACTHTGGFPGRPCPWACGAVVPEFATVECPPTPVAVVGGEASGGMAASLPPATLFATDDASHAGAPVATAKGEARDKANAAGRLPFATIAPGEAGARKTPDGPLTVPSSPGASHRGARNTDPETSLAAARSITDMRRRADHDLVLALLHEHGPLTDFDLARLASTRLGRTIGQTSLGVRRGEARDAGWVADSGLRGRSPSGSSCIRWALTAAGEGTVIGGAA